jgi:hypothetical protein
MGAPPEVTGVLLRARVGQRQRPTSSSERGRGRRPPSSADERSSSEHGRRHAGAVGGDGWRQAGTVGDDGRRCDGVVGARW